MAITEVLRLLVEADAKGAIGEVERLGSTSQREADRSEKALDRWGNRLTSVGAGMVGFGAVAMVGLKSAGDAAAELEQAVGGTEAVFGASTEVIDDYAANAADKLGLSERAFRELTTVAGAQLKNLGFSVDEAAQKSIELTEVGADLAATYGGTTAEAVEALGAAFRGEADPAERFGLSLNQTAVNAKAVELGLAASTSEVDGNAKAQATLALITEQSADAQGQFAREADTAAGRQQRLNASFEDLKAKIGTSVLPVMNTLVDVGGDAVGMVTDLDEATGGAVGKVATFGTVALLAGGGVSTLAGQVLKSKDGLLTLINAGSNLVGALGGVKKAAFAAAGVAGVGALIFAVDQMRDARNAKALDEMAEGLMAIDFAATEASKKAIRNAEAFGFLDEQFKAAEQSGGDASKRLVDLMEKSGVSADTVEHYRDEIEQHDAATKNAAASQEELAGEVENTGNSFSTQEEQVKAAEDALKDYTDRLRGNLDPLLAMSTALADNQEAQAGVREAQEALNVAIRDHGPTSNEAAEAQRNLDAAYRESVSSALDLNVAAAELEAGIENGTISVADAKRQLEVWVAQGQISRETARQMGRQMDIAGLKALALGQTDPHVNITTSGLEYAIGAFDRLAGAINDALREANNFGSGPSGTHISVGGGGGLILHEGGIVPGPRGREIAAILQGGEEVLALDDPRNSANANRMLEDPQLVGAGFRRGGDTYITVNVAGSVLSERQLIRVINRANRKGQGLN